MKHVHLYGEFKGIVKPMTKVRWKPVIHRNKEQHNDNPDAYFTQLIDERFKRKTNKNGRKNLDNTLSSVGKKYLTDHIEFNITYRNKTTDYYQWCISYIIMLKCKFSFNDNLELQRRKENEYRIIKRKNSSKHTLKLALQDIYPKIYTIRHFLHQYELPNLSVGLQKGPRESLIAEDIHFEECCVYFSLPQTVQKASNLLF